MKLYIAGPITGIVDYKKRFASAQKQLEHAGYGVINPTTLAHKDTKNWQQCMRLDIATMVKEADGVALLKGWHMSDGAWLEYHIARALGMRVGTIEEWHKGSGCYR